MDSFGDDRAECVDDELVEDEGGEEAPGSRWVVQSKRWRVVRERMVREDATAPEQAEGRTEETSGVWYMYVFTKL
jgi:hypothetical protein